MRKIILYAKFSPFQMFLLVSFFLFSFNFTNAFEKNCGEIEGIEFTNGDSTQAISSGGSYNLDSLPENFYVNVNFDGRVRSVRYIVKNIDTNQQYSILENFKPFTFPAGNSPWKLGEGNFSVKVKVYKYRFGIGRVCDQETFIFSLSNRECTADAGTLTADESSVSLESLGVMISAKPNGDIHVPTGYSTIYVLTSGEGLVIEQVNADSPSFTVETAGLYTIHTLVYDGNEDSANYLNLGVVEFGTTTGGQVLGIVGDNGLCAALDVTGAPIMVECTADAGTLTADESSVSLESPGVMISAKPNGDIHVPTGYSTIYVLTSGEGLVIEQVNADSPSFIVETAGLYTIHTLVYDGNADSANYLNLGVVEFGTTTGGQVLGIVVDNGLCAALDVTGAPIMVEEEESCDANAGTLKPNNIISCLGGDTSLISAYEYKTPVIPNGYQQLFVLTNAFDLTILEVSTSPEFDVNHVGFYRIHSLVYNPETLDLGIVQFGQTTGFDVNGLLQQGGGEICASLDVQGAVFLVIPSWICSWFNYSYNSRGGNQFSIVDGYINQFENYDAFEDYILKDAEAKIYPNPANDVLNIDLKFFDNEKMSYTIMDLSGRLIQIGSLNEIEKSGNTLNTSQLVDGMYLIKFTSDYRNFVKKIQVKN